MRFKEKIYITKNSKKKKRLKKGQTYHTQGARVGEKEMGVMLGWAFIRCHWSYILEMGRLIQKSILLLPIQIFDSL